MTFMGISYKYILVIVFLLVILFVLFYLIYNKFIKKDVDNEIIKNKEDLLDMKNVSEKLENLAKSKQMEISSYEDEQEEKAIISYEELLAQTQNVSINYSDAILDEDVLIKKVDLEKTGRIELDPIKQESNSKVSISYEHEEEFLETLKQLQGLLN